MTSSHSQTGDDIAEMTIMYRRLAAMDPPALRAFAGELERLSDDSSASASRSEA